MSCVDWNLGHGPTALGASFISSDLSLEGSRSRWAIHASRSRDFGVSTCGVLKNRFRDFMRDGSLNTLKIGSSENTSEGGRWGDVSSTSAYFCTGDTFSSGMGLRVLPSSFASTFWAWLLAYVLDQVPTCSCTFFQSRPYMRYPSRNNLCSVSVHHPVLKALALESLL